MNYRILNLIIPLCEILAKQLLREILLRRIPRKANQIHVQQTLMEIGS
jgi:hypothetical protein